MVLGRRNLLQLLLILVACSTMAHAQAAKSVAGGQPVSTVMTNADIVKLVKAGLSDSLVIAAIRGAKKTSFTVTADALIRLKADGIAEPVIATMLNPEAPFAIASTIDSATTTKASSIDPGDPLAPRDAGIYLNVKTERRTQLVALEPTVFSQSKSGGWLGSALTYGIKKRNWKAVVRSARANQRTYNGLPTFYFYFEQKSSGLSNTGGFAGWVSGASSPNEFILARMDRKSDSRELIVGELGRFGSNSGTRSKDTVAMKIEKLGPGVYRVTPADPLMVGEYCFFFAGSSQLGVGAAQYGLDMGVGATGKLFDFGVDSSG